MNIFKFFEKRNNITTDYKLIDLDWSDSNISDYSLDDVMSRNIDGLIVHNVLTEIQIQQIIRGLKKINNNPMDQDGFSIFTYPETFFQLAADFNERSTYQAYFEGREEFWNRLKLEFEIDLVEIVSCVLGRLAGGKSIEPPPGMNNKGFCNPLTIRSYPHEDGHLSPHCDSNFHQEYPDFFSHLREVSKMENQLSFFITLQAPESGGELMLYHIEWKNAREKESDAVIIDLTGRRINLKNGDLSNQSLQFKPGDLFVFPGGDIWHAVSHVQGRRPRVTMGGFITRTKDGDGFYIWS